MHTTLTRAIEQLRAELAKTPATERRHALHVKVDGKLEACLRIIAQDEQDVAAEAAAPAASPAAN